MANALTTVYKFTQPEVGAADDQWGDLLNANWGKVDNVLASASRSETGFVGGSATSLGTAIRVVGSGTPYVEWCETDVSLPAGHYRAEVSGGTWALRANTAAAGDYSTSEVMLTASWTSGFTFQTPVEFVAGPIIHNSSPTLRFDEDDLVAPAGQYRFIGVADSFSLQRALTANHVTNDIIWRYSGGSGILTLEKPTDFTSSPRILDISPRLTFEETDQTAPAGRFRFHASAGGFYFQRATTADWASVSTLWSYDAAGLTFMPDCKLATAGGNVELGLSTNSTLEFKRTSNPSYLKVPDGASLRVQNASGVTWANVSSASGWAAGTSDVRLKQNVCDIHYGLDTIMALRPIQFDWIAERRHDIGFSAQDVEKIIPEIVELWPADPDNEGEIDTYAMRKDALVAVLVRAVQELAARLETLEGGSRARA